MNFPDTYGEECQSFAKVDQTLQISGHWQGARKLVVFMVYGWCDHFVLATLDGVGGLLFKPVIFI